MIRLRIADTAARLLALALAITPPLAAQTMACEPMSQRAGREFGCFITAREELGALPKDSALFWHIDRYSSRAAAEAARGPHGTVVESLGKVWLFTIAGSEWRPPAGERVIEVGPLPLIEADSFAAVYMEATFQPGMNSRIHRHPGAEAWYTLEGAQCLETSEGKQVQQAGGAGMIVRGGLPMQLTAIGTTVRRSLVLLLVDATKPITMVATDWAPTGLCTR